MSFQPGIDAPIEIIGGLVADVAPAMLPLGVSPDCQDLIFSKSSAETRPGLTAQFAALAGNPTVNYLKTFQKQDGTLRLLAYDGLGNLFKESVAGVLSSVLNGVGPQSPWATSSTAFGREYLGFGDGKNGQDIPRQFDDTYLDRVSQVGPGAGPQVADEVLSFALLASPNGAVPLAAVPNLDFTQSGNTVTARAAAGNVALAGVNQKWLRVGDQVSIAASPIAGYNGIQTVTAVTYAANGIDVVNFSYVVPVSGLANDNSASGTWKLAMYNFVTAAAATLAVGQLVTTSGVGVGGYNGTFTVVGTTGGAGTSFFVYIAGQFALAASGAGTIASAGNISAGVHQVSVIFVTRQGYLTAPSPAVSWPAGGLRRAVVSTIPIGPPNVVARILSFTGAGGASFYFTPGQQTNIFSGNMLIADNTTKSATVDFSDAVLLAGTNVDYLFNLIELGEVQGVESYSSRLFWFGERNKLNNWQNLTFDGGFSNPGALPNFPLGFVQDATFAPGGASALAQGAPVIWGDAYMIVGNGGTPTRGLITQTAVQDSFGVARIAANTDYSVRARVAIGGGLVAGTLNIDLFSALGMIDTNGLQVTAAQGSAGYVEFTAQLTAPLLTIPTDLVLRIFADGTPTLNGYFLVENVEIYPTNQPFNSSLVRASRVNDPESIDGVNGLLSVAENNGQAMRAIFKMRSKLYFAKERSLYGTTDPGSGEPATWQIDEITSRVGTVSPRGIGFGEDWVILADRSGLYIFWGAEPQKISQEVGHSASGLVLAWDQINWQYGQTLWVAVDTQERRIYVGAPFGTATSPNFILQMDYRDIDGGADVIAGSPPIRIRYTGVKAVMDKSRKWSPWTVSANAGAIVERFDGTQQLFLGSGAYGNQNSTGKIYQLDSANLNDDGFAIPSYYLTAFTPQRETEQLLNLHAHRKLFTYLTLYCEGLGLLNLTAFLANQANSQALPALRLTNPAMRDLEMTINVLAERVAFKLAPDTTEAGNWFRLQKLTPSVTGDPWAPVRGQN